jgi:hypothetical protein
MKKYIIVGACAVLLILAGWWILSRAQIAAEKSAVMGGLTADIRRFYGEHERLPLSWEEFAAWSNTAQDTNHWNAVDLNDKFALKWGAQVSANHPPLEKIFIVLDPRFKDIEPSANGLLYTWCIASATSDRH